MKSAAAFAAAALGIVAASASALAQSGRAQSLPYMPGAAPTAVAPGFTSPSNDQIGTTPAPSAATRDTGPIGNPNPGGPPTVGNPGGPPPIPTPPPR